MLEVSAVPLIFLQGDPIFCVLLLGHMRGVREISDYTRLSAQHFGGSTAGLASGPLRNLPQCGCWCLCGLKSIPATM